MYTYQPNDFENNQNRTMDPHYSISTCLPDFTPENFQIMAGDFNTIVYAFMVLFTGSLSDLFERKLLLCGACFGWTACTYLSSYVINYHQLLVLRLIMSFFTALSGPCSYSLISDWIEPNQRTMAFAYYALGV